MLSAALQQLAQDLHGVADAADRLASAPQISAEVRVVEGASTDKSRAEAIDRGQWNESMKKIIAAVRRDLDRR